jgi:hypothetical protein
VKRVFEPFSSYILPVLVLEEFDISGLYLRESFLFKSHPVQEHLDNKKFLSASLGLDSQLLKSLFVGVIETGCLVEELLSLPLKDQFAHAEILFLNYRTILGIFQTGSPLGGNERNLVD